NPRAQVIDGPAASKLDIQVFAIWRGTKNNLRKSNSGDSMSTITGTTIYQGVTLGTVNSSPTYASPLTINSTGAVYAPTTVGVFAPSGLAGTVINQGTITANHHGIKLLGGGYVNNQGGVIQGGIGS